MIELETRNCQAPLIPGWDGPEQIAYGNFDGDNLEDKAVVALDGGSARVMVIQNSGIVGVDGPILLNTICFDQNFRGGGRIAVVNYSTTADRSTPDALIVAPGAGGGPVVARFDFANGGRFDFFAPFQAEYRGGMFVSEGDVDGDQRPELLLIAGDTLKAIDMRTYETDCSVYVGPDARFEATGGTIQRGSDLFFYVQYGDVVGFNAESKLIPVPRR